MMVGRTALLLAIHKMFCINKERHIHTCMLALAQDNIMWDNIHAVS